MQDRDDHEGDLCREINEDDDYQHHRDSPGVSAMNVCRIARHCISRRIKKTLIPFSCLELRCATQFYEIGKVILKIDSSNFLPG